MRDSGRTGFCPRGGWRRVRTARPARVIGSVRYEMGGSDRLDARRVVSVPVGKRRRASAYMWVGPGRVQRGRLGSLGLRALMRWEAWITLGQIDRWAELQRRFSVLGPVTNRTSWLTSRGRR